MRPAVYASVVRNRKSNARRILRPPTFSIRRLLVMVFVGALLLAPGLTLTVLGLEDSKDPLDHQAPSQRALYKVIGPIAVAFGVFILFSALLYYFCYGLADHSSRSRHASAKSASHGHSTFSSVRSDKAHNGRHHSDPEEAARHRSESESSNRGSHHHHHSHSHHHHSTHHKRQPSHSKGNDYEKPATSKEVDVCIEDEHAPLSPRESSKPTSDV